MAINSFPTEILLKILIFCENPVPLSRTNSRLYNLFKHPVTKAEWLAENFKKNPILGALSLWNRKSVAWKKYLASGKLEYYHRNMFDDIKPCEVCKGTSIHLHSRCSSFEARVNDLQPFLSEVTGRYSTVANLGCEFERQQWEIILLLTETRRASFKDNSNIIIRFAALSRHMGLLGLVIEKLGSNVNSTSSNVNNMLDILFQAIEARNIMVVYECISSGILQKVTSNHYDKIIKLAVYTRDLNILCIILDAGPYTSCEIVLWVFQYASAYKWMYNDAKKLSLTMARYILHKLRPNVPDEEQQLIILKACEIGDVTIAKSIHSRAWELDGINGSSIFSTVINGHLDLLKFLLLEVRLNSNVFRRGDIIVIGITMFNHFCLFYALISSTISLICELYCETKGLSGSFQMFGFMQANNICYYTNSPLGWWFNFIPFVIFSLVYTLFYKSVPLLSLLKCIYLCNEDIRRRRSIGIGESAEHADQLV